MNSKRRFVQSVGLFAGGACLAATGVGAVGASSRSGWTMPDEADAHKRTWMAFGAHQDVWGKKLLPEVQRNLALIANSIAKFEPVSMLVRDEDFGLAQSLVSPAVSLVRFALDDLWIRDTGAVFVVDSTGRKAAVDFNFNGWGEKQDFARDAKVAGWMAQQAGVQRIQSALVLEGGGIEVDGQGTAIVTESCVLNDNRNPGVSKRACEAELKQLLGLNKIIWLPGIKGKDITDGHTDFYARFARPGVVLAGYDPDPQSFDHAVTKRHLEILRSATDAKGNKLDVLVLEAPSRVRPAFDSKDFAAGYVNFYVCKGAVIAPEFGDAKADAAARQTLQQVFAGRQVIQINVDGIAAGGGGIHCTTQQEPV